MLRRFFEKLTGTNYQSASFQELRTGCLNGHDGAKRVFINRFEGVVWRAVHARLPYASEQDKEEVVADTFIALLANDGALLARYDALKGSSPEAYIRRQAIMQSQNRARHLQSTKRQSEVYLQGENGMQLLESQADPKISPAQALEEEEALQALHRQLRAALSPTLWLTFEALYIRNLKIEDAALVLNCNAATLYTRKRRIGKILEDILSKQAEEEKLAQ